MFPGARIKDATERVEKVLGPGKVRTHKQARFEQIIMSEILPIMGSRGQGYRNYRRMAINTLIQQLCGRRKLYSWVCGVAFLGGMTFFYEGWAPSK